MWFRAFAAKSCGCPKVQKKNGPLVGPLEAWKPCGSKFEGRQFTRFVVVFNCFQLVLVSYDGPMVLLPFD